MNNSPSPSFAKATEGRPLTSSAGNEKVLLSFKDFADGDLVHGFDEHFINVHMGRAGGDPNEDFGNVFRDEGMGAFIEFFGGDGIAFEAHEGKFSFGEAGIHGADANAGAEEFEAQSARDLEFGRFGAAIDATAFVSSMAGDGTDIDDARAGVARNQGQGRAGHAQEAKDIGLKHGFPIGVFALGEGVQAVSAASIVDENMELRGFFPGPTDKFFDAIGFGHVEEMYMGFGSTSYFGFPGDFFQAVGTARPEQQFGAFGSEGPGGGGAKAGGSAGNEDPFLLEGKFHGGNLLEIGKGTREMKIEKHPSTMLQLPEKSLQEGSKASLTNLALTFRRS